MQSLRTPPKKKRATPKNTRSKKNDDELGSSQGHLKIEDYEIIIDWLRDKKNYVACFGNGKAPAIGRQPKAMINGYELMAIHLQNVSPTKINPPVSPENLGFKPMINVSSSSVWDRIHAGAGTPESLTTPVNTLSETGLTQLYSKHSELIRLRLTQLNSSQLSSPSICTQLTRLGLTQLNSAQPVHVLSSSDSLSSPCKGTQLTGLTQLNSAHPVHVLSSSDSLSSTQLTLYMYSAHRTHSTQLSSPCTCTQLIGLTQLNSAHPVHVLSSSDSLSSTQLTL
ncbi:hypothetical protein PGTUg99_011232 [Puccinia graminis f. sp. tritici]|uniref:Uncharacterized protein n=1 Tax=Puccinia graminis f. sp. tritici TaxID=56615 RepID=A0A5B0NT90_PUCGR|nr:hypothetical protein PGTUg99_011232 [Puccinia graminis f. sp. tritici]